MKYERAILQNRTEFDLFVALLKSENVRSYLEIGSKFGGSLWQMRNALPAGSRMVAVDLPHGDGSFKETQSSLESCITALCELGYDAHLILGDSKVSETIERVQKFSPFDAVFIDACHTLAGVTSDWEHYGAMARIAAFHDISWRRVRYAGKKAPIEVPKLWEQLKVQYRHKEIQLDHKDNGIGVLWRQ